VALLNDLFGIQARSGCFCAEPETALPRYLQEARRIIREVEATPPRAPLRDPKVTPEFEQARWFPLPGEALSELQARSAH
jgi:hypothetical protein